MKDHSYLLWAEKTIECSHTTYEEITKHKHVHGHSYWVRLYVKSSASNPVSVESLQNALHTVCRILDHKHLNDWVLEGTMEAMAQWLFENLDARFTYDIKKIEIERKSLGVGVEFLPN